MNRCRSAGILSASAGWKPAAQSRGLTLIELIVVMGLLATVMAISTPTLSRFVRGRELDEEARRFLALTRYARSEAISQSELMELWIEPETGLYGLSPHAGYGVDDSKRVEFRLADRLSFDVDVKEIDENGLAKILFWPDGSIDEESLEYLVIRQNEEEPVLIVQADYGLRYMIVDTEDDESWTQNIDWNEITL